MREYWVSDSFMNQGQNLSVYKEQRELPLLTEPLEQATLIILALIYQRTYLTKVFPEKENQ